MPTREETCSELRRTIREGTDKVILKCLTEGWLKPHEIRHFVFEYLHSQGFVIRMETRKDLTGCEIARFEPLIEELPEKLQPGKFWPQESSY